MKRILFAAVVCALTIFNAGPTRAQSPLVSTSGPFVGTMSEGWESFPRFGGTYLASPTSIMGGHATIANSMMAVYQSGQAFLGTSGTAQVADGTQGLMLNYFAQTATITWNTPIMEFGGYFAADTSSYNGDPTIVTVSFYGQSSTLLDTEIFSYSHSATGDGGLDWHGWLSATPVYSITLHGDFLTMDSLQAAIPEPSVTALVILAAVMMAGFTSIRAVMRNESKGQMPDSEG